MERPGIQIELRGHIGRKKLILTGFDGDAEGLLCILLIKICKLGRMLPAALGMPTAGTDNTGRNKLRRAAIKFDIGN